MTKICVQCRRRLDEKEFYKDRSGYPIEFCKDCAAKGIDFDNPHNTPALFIRLDIPICDVEWHKCDNQTPLTLDHLNHYIAKMKLYGYRDYRYKDTEEINSFFGLLEERLNEIEEHWQQELNESIWEKISNDKDDSSS